MISFVWIAAISIAATVNALAHIYCRTRPVSTLARHVIGVMVCLSAWSLAWATAPVNALAGVWITFGVSGAVVGLFYTLWHPPVTMADAIAKELADDIPDAFKRY